MTDLIMCLEPRFEKSKTIIIYELEEFNEVLFFNSGSIDIGFEINRKKKFVMRKLNSIVIADHGCTFNHQSNFIYKTHSACEGYSIRKEKWNKLLSEETEITQQLKKRISVNYFYHLQIKINAKKASEIRRLNHRSDI
jgi:myosin-crossreactive antigen